MIDLKFALSDISIEPTILSDIESRNECVPFYEDGTLPLFTAPMSTVIDEENYHLFKENNIIPIIPRTVDIGSRRGFLYENEWVAFGLDEIEEMVKIKPTHLITGTPHILIDIANGHMRKLYELVDQVKELNPFSVIMIGNIANPDTYKLCCLHGVDYVRVGIGGGSMCLTSSNLGIYFPMGSLISEIHQIKKKYEDEGKFITKIIADGGLKNYSDIIKCLALGADYCMCGKLFSQMKETPGDVFACDHNACWKYNQYSNEVINGSGLSKSHTLIKEVYGMSSKKAQQLMGKTDLKTSEGKIEKIEIKYTMKQWRDNMIDYMKSAMSYTGKRHLNEFIGNVDIIHLTGNASQGFNK